MANRLKVAMMQALLTLWRQGQSQRRIAELLGIHRETVARYVRRLEAATAKPAKVNIGSDAVHPAQMKAHGPPSDPGAGVEGDAGDPAKPAKVNIGSDGLSCLDPTAVDAAQTAKPPVCTSKPAKVNIGSDGHDASVADGFAPVPSDPVAASDLVTAALEQVLAEAAASGRRSAGERPSRCSPYRELIEAKLDQGLSVQRILQDLKTDHGFPGSYHSVRRFVLRLHPPGNEPFRRIEVAPGHEAQVDFGKGGWIVGLDGKRQRPHVLRVILSHSRKGYSEAVPRQTTDGFLRALENAFLLFGGAPRTVVLDNLRAAVTKADWFDPELNPKVLAFAAHYGTVFLPTKPRTPRHKGKVERGVGYVQDNALKGRTFASLVEQNRYLLEWEATVADTRLHGTTRKQVGKLFAEVEKPVLLPLPAECFPNFREAERSVHRDGHVEVERAYYSVPPEYLGRRVWARWDTRMVRIFNQRFEQIALHTVHLPGSFSTQTIHIPASKHNAIDRGAKALVAQARQLGEPIGVWAEAMLQDRGIAGVRALVGLLSLSKRHALDAVVDACTIAHRHAAYRLRTIRLLLQRRPAAAETRQSELPFLDAHPIIRGMAVYGEVATASAGRDGLGGRGTSGPSFPAPQTPHPSFPLPCSTGLEPATVACAFPDSLQETIP